MGREKWVGVRPTEGLAREEGMRTGQAGDEEGLAYEAPYALEAYNEEQYN